MGKSKKQLCIDAIERVRCEQRKAVHVIHAAYPVNSHISWQRGGHTQSGTILDNSSHGNGDNFRVSNDRTGKKYWISLYDIFQAGG